MQTKGIIESIVDSPARIHPAMVNQCRFPANSNIRDSSGFFFLFMILYPPKKKSVVSDSFQFPPTQIHLLFRQILFTE